MLLGAHMSAAGGVHRALERGLEVGCQAVQLFTRNQLRWRAPALPGDDVRRFRELSPAFAALLSHTSYLINLASPAGEIRGHSVRALVGELQRCAVLGIPLVVMHPGAHGGEGVSAGIRRLAQGARQAFDLAGHPAVRLLVETTAGAGTALGGRFAELGEILQRLEVEGVAAGLCVDTCHLLAAGYPLHPGDYARTWEELEKRVGLEHVRALHLNDSREALGSRRDRHQHIGRGQVGVESFRLLLRDPRLRALPGVLETPKEGGLRADRRNLAALRSLEAG
jgi:deoxyribonuclease-4